MTKQIKKPRQNPRNHEVENGQVYLQSKHFTTDGKYDWIKEIYPNKDKRLYCAVLKDNSIKVSEIKYKMNQWERDKVIFFQTCYNANIDKWRVGYFTLEGIKKWSDEDGELFETSLDAWLYREDLINNIQGFKTKPDFNKYKKLK